MLKANGAYGEYSDFLNSHRSKGITRKLRQLLPNGGLWIVETTSSILMRQFLQVWVVPRQWWF